MKISDHFVLSFIVALINLKLKAFPEVFLNIPRTLWQHSQESLLTFIILNIPYNLLEYSQEFSQVFLIIFSNIPQNVKMIIFPRIL